MIYSRVWCLCDPHAIVCVCLRVFVFARVRACLHACGLCVYWCILATVCSQCVPFSHRCILATVSLGNATGENVLNLKAAACLARRVFPLALRDLPLGCAAVILSRVQVGQ
jgi:hypothetical protein